MIQNKRDLGGLKTKDGKTIRPGMFVRSAQLTQAEDRDLDGVATIIDLRSIAEREEMPDQACGREYLPLPIFAKVNEGIDGVSHEEKKKQELIPDMAVLYGILMREYADSFRRVLLAIMEHDYSKGAVLWHCSEGKDRCGMTTALVLEALGVDRDIILEDYLKTNLINLPKAEAIREKLLKTHGKEMADGAYQAYIADERYIRAAWEEMGSDYITGRLGIPAEVLEAFRKAALE
ncbi:MAG: tyrosine-protein phosphatase [Clostridia bacterium]|nr:tyrosine-protein phosphatase [Clostridia bacterium]